MIPLRRSHRKAKTLMPGQKSRGMMCSPGLGRIAEAWPTCLTHVMVPGARL